MELKATLLILKAEFRQFLNNAAGTGSRRSKVTKLLRGWMGYLILAVIAIVIGRGVYSFTLGMNEALAGFPELARLMWVNLLSGISLAVFIMLFMTGISTVYQSMFEAGDVKFLLSTPAPVTSVVAAKLSMAAFTNFLAVSPFLYPVWAGFGAASSAPASFYLLALVAIVLAVVLFNALVAMLVMVIMRYVGSARMRQVILVGSLVVGFLIFTATQLLNATMSRRSGLNYADVAQIASALNLGAQSWSPHIWLLKTALLTMPGYAYSVWTSLVPLAASAALATAAAIQLSRHAFVVGWGHAREAARRRAGRQAARRNGEAPAAPRVLVNRWRGVGWAIFARDLSMVLRQPVLWYGVLVAIVTSGFFVYNVFGSGADMAERSDMMKAILVGMFTMMAGVSAGQFAGVCISIEGEALWLMQSAPISPTTYYAAKLAFATLPGGLVLVVLLLGTRLLSSVPQHPLYVSLPVGLGVLSAMTSLFVMADALKPNFNIRLSGIGAGGKKQDPGKALLSAFGSQIGTLVMGAVFAFPTFYDAIPWFAGWSITTATAVSLAVLAGMIITAHVIAGSVTIRKVRQLLGGGIN